MTEELMTRKIKDICNEANNEITVIWEKGETQNGGNKKQKKRTLPTP